MKKLFFATLLLSITTFGCNPTPSTDDETEYPKSAIVKQITFDYKDGDDNDDVDPDNDYSYKWLFHYDNDKLIKVDESYFTPLFGGVTSDDVMTFEHEKDLITAKYLGGVIRRFYFDSLEGKLLTSTYKNLHDSSSFNIDYTYQEDKIILANIASPSFSSLSRACIWENGNMKAYTDLSGQGYTIQYTDYVNNSNINFILLTHPGFLPDTLQCFIPTNGFESKNLPAKATAISDPTTYRTYSYTFNNEGLVSKVKVRLYGEDLFNTLTIHITY